jgi:hypothetical protein
VLQGESLSDESAHRPPEYAWALHVKHLDYSRGIIGELVDTKWPSVVRGGTDPAIVNEDELVGRREHVNKRRIPVRACRGEAVQDYKRSAISNSTISDFRVIDWDRR